MINQAITPKTSGCVHSCSGSTTLKSRRCRSFALSAAVAAVGLFAAHVAQATTYTFNTTGGTGGSPSLWSTSSWSPSTPISSQDNVFNFTSPTGQRMISSNDISSGFQLNGLNLTNNSSQTNGQSLTITGSSLNFVKDSSNALPAITLAKAANSAGTITISAAFTVTDALTITSAVNTSSPNPNTTAFSGNITNTGGITFNGTGTAPITLGGGSMSGAGGVTVNGSYAVNMTGTKSYAGGTTVSSGTLGLGSNLSGTSSVTVSGGTLTSSVSNVNLGVGAVSMSTGAITPGGVGVAGSFTLASGQNFTTTGGALNFDVGTASDQIIGSGTFSISSTSLALNQVAGFDYNNTYNLFSGFSPGTISGLMITGYDDALWVAALSNTGTLSFTAVPEPSTYAVLVGAFSLGVVALRRRRHVG